jgi:hypothetical protein
VVTLWPITFQCAGIFISAGLTCVYMYSQPHASSIPSTGGPSRKQLLHKSELSVTWHYVGKRGIGISWCTITVTIGDTEGKTHKILIRITGL